MKLVSNFLDNVFASSGGVSDMTNPALWLVNAMGGRKTASGQRVNEENALTLPAFWAAVRNVAEDHGALLFKVMHRQGKVTREAPEHPLWELLYNEPNVEMTSQAWREAGMGLALEYGNGYAEIERRGANAVALWPIHSSRVQILRTDRGELFYRVHSDPDKTPGRIQFVDFDPSEIFHLHNWSKDGISGLSLVRYMAEAIGAGIAQQDFAASYFGQGSQASGVLKYPKALGQDRTVIDKLRQQWQETYAGPENRLKPIILENGMEWQQLSIANEAAQFLESRQFTVEEMARITRIPPHKIGHLAKATWANIEHLEKQYYTDVIKPWARRWEYEADRKLLTQRDRAEGYFTSIEFNPLEFADTKTRAEYHNLSIQGGWRTPNNAREVEGLDPAPPEIGDRYYIQSGTLPIDIIIEKEQKGMEAQDAAIEAAKNPPEPPVDDDQGGEDEDDGDEARESALAMFRPMIARVAERCCDKEARAHERAKAKGAQAFGAWAAKFRGEHADMITRELSPIAEGLALCGLSLEPSTCATLLMLKYRAEGAPENPMEAPRFAEIVEDMILEQDHAKV